MWMAIFSFPSFFPGFEAKKDENRTMHALANGMQKVGIDGSNDSQRSLSLFRFGIMLSVFRGPIGQVSDGNR